MGKIQIAPHRKKNDWMNGLPCGQREINPTVDPQRDCITHTLEFSHQEER